MIELYTWTTPNGRKISMALEEMGLPYVLKPINIHKDEQFAPEFLKISPNNKIPAIVDTETGISMMESGAILLYLAEKTGKLLPADPAGRWKVIEWLMFQMGGAGPILGQVHHFHKFNPGKAPYAEERFVNEAKRLYGVMDKQLASNEFFAGDLSIADFAIWPWIGRHDWQEINLNEFPNVKRWYLAMADRPSVQTGWNIPPTDQKIPMPA